jgi:hypothetical protein
LPQKDFHGLGGLTTDDRNSIGGHQVIGLPIGVMTATGAFTTLVASHRPPSPTSMTAMSTGASANAANAMAVTTSNLLIAGPPAASDWASTSCTNGSISR